MKNDYEVRGKITVIYLNSPKHGVLETIISTDRLLRVLEFPNTWYAHLQKESGNFYVNGNYNTPQFRTTTYALHRWIMGIHKGKVIDHINHNTLDNTDENLRILTISENGQNRKGVLNRNTSGISGVHWHKASCTWETQLRVNGVKMNFGNYTDIQEAAKAIDKARKIHMPFAPSQIL